MQFASSSLADVGLGSIVSATDPAIDPETLRPIATEWNGVDARDVVNMDSLQIQDTLGQPVTCNFTMTNPLLTPKPGDTIRVRYFAQVIFAGTIDHVERSSPDLRNVIYTIDCLDWSQTLIRRKIRRSFTDVSIQTILDSILDNELAGELLTIGTIESRSTMPLVDSRNGKFLDVVREMAAATGQTFYVDFDQSLQMRSLSAPLAPFVLSEANVLMMGTANKIDRETYRNVQTIVTTGTPVDNEAAVVATVQKRNQDQIDERIAIEGGAGIYEEIEEITHPTSNDPIDVTLLGLGYATLRLAASGSLRQTFSCSVLGYGFRAGQVATVDLPTFGLAGTYVIQRVTIRELAGAVLFHDLELTTSSLRQRAYESWLGVIKTGKVTVQSPTAITNNVQIFDTPGVFIWTVPPTIVIIQLECVGGSASGSGGAAYTGLQNGNAPYPCAGGGQYTSTDLGVNGGKGGNSGRAVIVLDVTPGEEIAIVVGAAGAAGVSDAIAYHNLSSGSESTAATDGAIGTPSTASYRGAIVCQGNGGYVGTHGRVTIARIPQSSFIQQRICLYPGVDGSDNASGIGDAVSAGGGKLGGSAGTGFPFSQPTDGSDGSVTVRW